MDNEDTVKSSKLRRELILLRNDVVEHGLSSNCSTVWSKTDLQLRERAHRKWVECEEKNELR